MLESSFSAYKSLAVVVNCDVIVCVFEPRDVFWDRFSRSCRVRVRKHGFRAVLFSVASRM